MSQLQGSPAELRLNQSQSTFKGREECTNHNICLVWCDLIVLDSNPSRKGWVSASRETLPIERAQLNTVSDTIPFAVDDASCAYELGRTAWSRIDAAIVGPGVVVFEGISQYSPRFAELVLCDNTKQDFLCSARAYSRYVSIAMGGESL